jgi:type IV secretion system protein VirB8
MNDMSEETLTDYYREAQSWSADREAANVKSRKTAWIVAGAATAVAVLEAVALVVLLPLKTVVPYTLLVDKQTGYVQALKPLDGQSITPNEAMERSFLAQYVIARESFDIDSLRDSYRKVALWSDGEARSRYVADTQASNPMSPLATLPRRALVEIEVRSISSIGADTAMVRYVSTRTDPGGRRHSPQSWVSVIKYRFSGDAMSAEDRLTNPLGFQVVRYRRDAEMAPAVSPAAEQAEQASTVQSAPAQASAAPVNPQAAAARGRQ